MHARASIKCRRAKVVFNNFGACSKCSSFSQHAWLYYCWGMSKFILWIHQKTKHFRVYQFFWLGVLN